jgi:hypothetical protein
MQIEENSYALWEFSGGLVVSMDITAAAQSGMEALHFVAGTNKPVSVW